MGNSSSATMTTNMLSIKSSIFKSHIFKPQVLNQQEQQLPRLAPPPEIPVYQLTTPNPSNNSLPSRPASPVNSLYSGKKPVVQPVTPSGSEVPSLLDGAQVSRPATPTNETPVSLSIKKGHKIPRVRTKRDPAVSSSSMASPLPDGQEAGRELYGHPQDHYFSTVFDDLRSKTQNVLRKAGFSIAPDAGLFADRGAGKHTDLKVVRMPPVSTASTPATDAPSGNKDAKDTTGKSLGFFGRARSRSVKERPPSLMNFQMPPIPTFTPASPSRSPMNTTPSTATDTASTTTSSTATTPMTTSNGPASGSPSGSKLDRLRHWNMSDWGGHQRSNSGPARHSDLSLAQKLVEMEDPRLMDFYAQGKAEGRVHIPPLPPLPPLPPKVMADGGVSGGPEDIRKKKKGHQRRMSEATTLSVASTESTGAYPQRFQIHPFQRQQLPPLQQQPPVERHHRTMSNWFGMGKRRSLYGGEEDFKRPYTVGSTIENGMNSRPTSGLLLEGDDYETDMFDDTDVDDDEQDSQAQHRGDAASTEDRDSTDRSLATDSTERRSHVVVNDYGFILEDTEEESRTGQQELTGTSSSSIMGDVTVKLDSSFLAGHERKKMLKKQQEQNKLDVAKWIQAVTQLEPDQAKKSSKLKKLARRGVPISVRGRVWQFLARSNHYRKPGVFQELLTRGHIPIYDVIARDIDRCYPDHVHFRDGMGGTGQEDLHSILKAYAHYKPSVGYCQGMGRLVGMMLMQMPVEEAFWLLVATIEGYLNEYFTPTLRQLRIDAQVFERLLKSQDPRLAQHLHRNDVSPIMYITQWFLTLFTMSLPWASVLRVWDVFYFDGVKTLFRVGLAVLQICRQHLLEQCPSSSECIDYLLHVPLEILGPEVLLEQTAYRIRLRRENIQKMSAITAGEMDAKEGPPSGTGNAVELHGSRNRKSGAYLYEVHEQNENKAKLGASVPLARPLPFKETRVANHVRAGSLGSPIAVRSLASSVDPVMITAALGAIPTTTTTVAATTTSTRMTTTVAPTHDQTSNYRNAKEGFAGETNAGEEVRNEAGLRSMATDNPTSTSTSVFTKNRPELPRPRSQPSGSRLFMTSTPSLPGAVEDLSPAPLSSFLLAAPSSTTATTTNCSASLSSTPSGFSPLSIFKTRKRAGTMHR
ncbi:hypothetical protein BGZ99_003244 [Dissophora globulifera]|uniref:Rab-GAP TBC domain-containing protein n=1 Tax=Dissophora globulifera TaxID=979702 RepID=A0A9P6RNJ5_9FUNG|nr:hypothetical protein BGZ99_003244 [Dissophora globulifera]